MNIYTFLRAVLAFSAVVLALGAGISLERGDWSMMTSQLIVASIAGAGLVVRNLRP
jgi:hypothetical protein